MCWPTKPEHYIERIEGLITKDQLEHLLSQVDPEKMSAGPYRVTEINEHNHEWGHGGYRKDTTQLLKGDQSLILSIYYDSWSTTSDDSTDYAGPQTKHTHLLQEDPVARQIFDLLRTQLQKAQPNTKGES